MSPVGVARVATLVGIFGLLALGLAWALWLAPSVHFPLAWILLLWAGPLLVALPGIVRGSPYTHAWTSMLALAYFAHGLVEAIDSPAERLYATAEALLALSLYGGAMLYARWEGRLRKARGENPR